MNTERSNSNDQGSSPGSAPNSGAGGLISIGGLAEATGLTVLRIRAWENRYGYPKAVKLPSGHRRYKADEVEKVMLLKRVVDLGHPPRKTAHLTKEELRELLQMEEARNGSRDLIQKALRYTADTEQNDLTQLFEGVWNKLGAIDFVKAFAQPFVFEVGELWIKGKISIAQEHFGSAILESFLSNKLTELNQSLEGRAILITTPTGELHSLGILFASIMTVASGVRVIYLGPNVPADDIIAFVNVRNDIWAVGLGVSKAYPKKKGATFINRLSKNFPSQIQILLGGEGGKRLETKTARWIKSWPEFMENLKKYDNTLLPTSSQSR